MSGGINGGTNQQASPVAARSPILGLLQSQLMRQAGGGRMGIGDTLGPVRSPYQTLMGAPRQNQYQQLLGQMLPGIQQGLSPQAPSSQPAAGQSPFPTMFQPYNPRGTLTNNMGPAPVVQPDLTDFNRLFDERIRNYIPENAMPGYAGE